MSRFPKRSSTLPLLLFPPLMGWMECRSSFHLVRCVCRCVVESEQTNPVQDTHNTTQQTKRTWYRWKLASASESESPEDSDMELES